MKGETCEQRGCTVTTTNRTGMRCDATSFNWLCVHCPARDHPKKYEALGYYREQLEQLVGEKEAAIITTEIYVKVIG